MLTSRRVFLAAMAATTAIGTLRRAHAQVSNLPASRIRRDVNSILPDDPIITTYRDAVAEMQARNSSDPLSWENQATIHQNYCPHGNWFFLPWHRAYIVQFEDIIRQISGNAGWALPYWDWTQNPQIPTPFWDDGSPLNHPRGIDSTTNMPAEFVGRSVIDSLMAKGSFPDFASYKSSSPYNGSGGGTAELEGRPHNNVHNRIGGDMQTLMSPRDPIFWLHHGNVDRLWASWNALGNANTADPDLADFTFNASQSDRFGTVNTSQFVNPDGTPRNFTVRDLYVTEPLGYRYDRLESVVPNTFFIAARSLAIESINRETITTDITRTASAGSALETALAVQPALTESVADTGRLKTLSQFSVSTPVVTQQIFTATLIVRGLQTSAGPDTVFRVFINCDYLSLDTPINDPHYVGSAAFFLTGVIGEVAQDHSNHAIGADFVFDLTDTLDALRRAGTPVKGQITPQVIGLRSDGSGTELAIDGAFEITVETVG